MKRKSFIALIACLTTFISNAFAGTIRSYENLDAGWNFHFSYDCRKKPVLQQVTLPHTWNATDVFSGQLQYYRGAGIYNRSLAYNPAWKDKRVFLYFEGANSVADVLVNNKFVTEHKGGYTAFCTEITSYLIPGSDNALTVQVSNAPSMEVLPLSGDFNVFGGLHRSVWLIVTNKNCITPLDYASPGVYITPATVSTTQATVDVQTKLSLPLSGHKLEARTVIRDAANKTVASMQTLINNGDSAVQQQFKIDNPHLWNGRQDPYLYQVSVQLYQDDQLADEMVQPLGLRTFKVDASTGFILNGKHLDLHGFGMHEDVKDRGSALLPSDHKGEMALIMESGANAMRLTHYPHGNYFYQLADTSGIIVWTEIPLVGPGGYTGTGFINSPALKAHARQLLTEMIRQQYNHPSILFWGLFNELKLNYDDPRPFLTDLQALAKKEDPSRIITCATFLDTDYFNTVSDVIAWNKYYGWYGGSFSDIGTWADDMHRQFPTKPIAVSEYGAGANILQHQETMKAPSADGNFHPEEWQTAYHEANWAALNARPFVWGKFVWALADFSSAIRTEGNVDGLNDKGLVTYDHKIKKDAFYFYKANWSKEPMLYLAEKRANERTMASTTVKAYTNLTKATLYVNGKNIGTVSRDSIGRVIWPQVALQAGKNTLLVKAAGNGATLEDGCTWILNTPATINHSSTK
ncbi:glycoside hydrolase family 2 protein [Chitinophaga sp. Cy-1792]|uniref:glycoside hydrolase family 2 protein n=1 Tax=Chitinophaga sp. Cy-1792 TaxID=2608339 RepID=UPI001421A0C6|nr:glycoside hydrolase family 2 TIM barrel-domain containing protein [Chitinophaga sp. Cy-1792]NIG53854.1 beta-galactosidase [Chitinophaga sp. Cy-1792]